MADKKENRGGYRPGSGRKPIPPDDIARIKRMRQAGISRCSIAKTLGYSDPTIYRYAEKIRDDDDE